jgi:hypothetical protein
MFSYLTGPQFILLIAGCIVGYYALLALYCKRRPQQPAFSTSKQPLSASRSPIMGAPQDLIGAPAPEWEEELEMFLDREPEGNYSIEMLDDDDSILLKEAERVVEEIQKVIDNIASNPPNPEEVFTKIRAIVRQYRIFQNTVYYEAVNNFIAQAVLRDCGIAWTADDLMVLWT